MLRYHVLTVGACYINKNIFSRDMKDVVEVFVIKLWIWFNSKDCNSTYSTHQIMSIWCIKVVIWSFNTFQLSNCVHTVHKGCDIRFYLLVSLISVRTYGTGKKYYVKCFLFTWGSDLAPKHGHLYPSYHVHMVHKSCDIMLWQFFIFNYKLWC